MTVVIDWLMIAGSELLLRCAPPLRLAARLDGRDRQVHFYLRAVLVGGRESFRVGGIT
jgi:hypothetical protein